MSGSLAGYNNPLEDLDQSPPPPAQDLHHAGGGFRPKLTMSSAGGGGCRYRECLKNHAASVGGNVTDGCGEFMPSGDDGTLEALKCAACNCHRNFHRKERGGGEAGVMTVHPLQLPAPPLAPSMTSPSSTNHHSYHRSGPWSAPPPPTLTAPPPARTAGYGSGAATDSSSEEMNFNAYQSSAAYGAAAGGKKRFRTKFSQGQKEKMMEFAEKLGWRIPREDDSQLQTFCAEVGVKRQVFKVWMHNNKNSAAKKNNNPIHINNNNNPHHQHHHHHDDEEEEEEEDRRSSHQTLPGIAGI
ncbi:unnamed protein product [Cuscuta campestris]|uniref:ZF-HD dimerization-type domain-containing protein n=1 Tax=Cuscuta campestris TaxID=132261 RepID=A0A484KRD3_9ASTE|nr:unnamed protein product [Cuscuta campestris]